jgi:hypothetical protein
MARDRASEIAHRPWTLRGQWVAMVLDLSCPDEWERALRTRPKDDVHSAIFLVRAAGFPGFKSHGMEPIANEILKIGG